MKTRFTQHLFAYCLSLCATTALQATPPNFFVIVTEDISPNLGCYGDPDAITPNLDAFAKDSVRYTQAYSHSPVCAPTRSGFITGQYPTKIGSHHMRSTLANPPPLFTEDLKQAGYHIHYPGKTDFNFTPQKNFANKDPWHNPAKIQLTPPFFAYANFTGTHESQASFLPGSKEYIDNTAKLSPEHFRDPTKIILPPYYPDHPNIRRQIATYHENITAFDLQFGALISKIKSAGLYENSYIIFFGDHGWGMPRGKRWLYNAGTKIPLLIHLPSQHNAGTTNDQIVSILDLAPTLCNLANAPATSRFDGQIILGPQTSPPREYFVHIRDRMDESHDRIRSVRSQKFLYIKNYHPEIPYAQWLTYPDSTPIMMAWRQLAFENKLNPTQKLFFAKQKPIEEFYILSEDPHQINNQIENSQYQIEIEKHRQHLLQWQQKIPDLGETPEQELIQQGILIDDWHQGQNYQKKLDQHPKTSPIP
jgi:uncharacterized sulfatase